MRLFQHEDGVELGSGWGGVGGGVEVGETTPLQEELLTHFVWVQYGKINKIKIKRAVFQAKV